MSDTRYLTLSDIMAVALRAEPGTAVRDAGLLDSALHRPQATVFGQDAYPDLYTKAAALMQSLIVSHPFVDGNKRTGWGCMELFLAYNGIDLLRVIDVESAETFTLAIAAGEIEDVAVIAAQLASWTPQPEAG